LARVAKLDFLEEDTETFPYLTTYKMRPDKNLMNKQEVHKPNEMYWTEITGTGNQTAVM